jgi:hypothetical protein
MPIVPLPAVYDAPLRPLNHLAGLAAAAAELHQWSIQNRMVTPLITPMRPCEHEAHHIVEATTEDCQMIDLIIEQLKMTKVRRLSNNVLMELISYHVGY